MIRVTVEVEGYSYDFRIVCEESITASDDTTISERVERQAKQAVASMRAALKASP